MASVRPIEGRAKPAAPIAVPVAAPPRTAPVKSPPPKFVKIRPAPVPAALVAARPPAPPKPAAKATLDGGWDKRLARGLVSPESSIDLHGHTLSTAHRVLDAGLADAITRGDRVLLLVTGKPPRADAERPYGRGAIRAAIGDWLAGSRHADRIAAVRGAHPRHGGAGALYIVLRRARTG
ncbi:Smr/MutS family protein [Sphingomonas qomolangmaensis]|uniref:Smr/MutS family protein n=1 Tax=Sphingomonas qomolangmaensis TaxID=2918765 RepID=A0ABY5L9A9_9SPHN|nr:Smr/MutS family protein [Sphingomonas qomolangmaensis]UUL83032.1 Smr/MutS family protein [Sphingomonas qomolangmaensis]